MRLASLLGISVLPLLTGCVIEVQDVSSSNGNNHYEVYNDAPVIDYADAGCYWDNYNRDYIWWFEADVFDSDGYGDVAAVYADLFDSNGHWVDGFELFQETPAPELWFSDWLELSTYLDCSWGDYIVEFTAYDWSDAYDNVSVVPYYY